jgi:hypothetical protein
MSRKEAKPQRFSPPWWISPPVAENQKNQRFFSFPIRVKITPLPLTFLQMIDRKLFYQSFIYYF